MQLGGPRAVPQQVFQAVQVAPHIAGAFGAPARETGIVRVLAAGVLFADPRRCPGCGIRGRQESPAKLAKALAWLADLGNVAADRICLTPQAPWGVSCRPFPRPARVAERQSDDRLFLSVVSPVEPDVETAKAAKAASVGDRGSSVPEPAGAAAA